MDKTTNKITVQEWELLIQDFHNLSDACNKWFPQHSGISILEQALVILGKKEPGLKQQLLVFLEENAETLLLEEDDPAPALILLMDALKASIYQVAADGANITMSLKEQMMVTVTSIMISTEALHKAPRQFEDLVELLLNLIIRQNSLADRQLRASACECLRQLETIYPCLLHICAGHLLSLCQSERTHAIQSYILLLTIVLHNLAHHMHITKNLNHFGSHSILSTAIPLVPFSIPPFLMSADLMPQALTIKDFSPENVKEFRRAIGFLLECPSFLTENGLVEFITEITIIASALDLQGSLLKFQFSSLLYTYSPALCHMLVIIYSQFMEAFEGEKMVLFRCLIMLSRDVTQLVPVRLLAIHWLLGLENLLAARKRSSILAPMAPSLYPLIFDPLSLKAVKLISLAHCAACLEEASFMQNAGAASMQVLKAFDDSASKLLIDGLIGVSAYKWLPSWSMETRLTFFTLHRFLTTKAWKNYSRDKKLISPLFQTLQDTLILMAKKTKRLVQSILILMDRLMLCDTHHDLGEWLLRAFSERLLPEIPANSYLSSYFPLMERIAENSKIPPASVLESLTSYARYKVKTADPGNNSSNLWLRGSQILDICRTVLMHHQSSRIFRHLTRLLGFLCRFFPDIEIRDTARLYLRILISVPGKRLRQILSYGDQRIEDAKPQFSHVSSLFSPRPGKEAKQVASYIQLTRIIPLLVPPTWSVVLHGLFTSNASNTGNAPVEKMSLPLAILADNVKEREADKAAELQLTLEDVPTQSPGKVLRVMDTETSEMLSILRRHFLVIPDYLHGPGFKIAVKCNIRFIWEINDRITEADQTTGRCPEIASSQPGIYAIVITFSTSGPYGTIPSVHVPFLLGEPSMSTCQEPRPQNDTSKSDDESCVDESCIRPVAGDMQLAIVAIGDPTENVEFGKTISVNLEPKQPAPTILDAKIEYSDDNGQTVTGRLDSIAVGIEDLFVKPLVPSDVAFSDVITYQYRLFNALWTACSGPGKLGTETFFLKGGQQPVDIKGSESVKLLEAPAEIVITSIQKHLQHFVVGIGGEDLISFSRSRSIFDDAVLQEVHELPSLKGLSTTGSSNVNREEILQIQYLERSQDNDELETMGSVEWGYLLLLIFLPPRYHLLLKVEVSDLSTLVRMRTDHWPCLAYIDEYLEAFTNSTMSNP